MNRFFLLNMKKRQRRLKFSFDIPPSPTISVPSGVPVWVCDDVHLKT